MPLRWFGVHARTRLVIATGAALVLVASAPAAAHAVADPAFMERHSATEQAVIKDWIGSLRQYEPVPPTQDSYKGRQAAKAIVERMARVPTSAPAAEAVQTATVRAAQSTGVFPRLWQGAGLLARARGTQLLTRASVVGTGAFVLWEIGCGPAGLCKKIELKVAEASATHVRLQWTGPDGACPSGSSATSATAVFTPVPCASGTSYKRGTLQQLPYAHPTFPANVLGVLFSPDGATNNWYRMSQCLEDFKYVIYYTGTGDTPAGCSFIYPSGALDGAYRGVIGTQSSYEKIYADHQNPAGCSAPCYARWYSNGVKLWYRDPLSDTRAFGAFTDTDPEGWDTVPANDPSRVKSPDLPPEPSPGQLAADLETFLEADDPDAIALRQELEHALDQLPADDDPVWQDPDHVPTLPDVGPVYGNFVMPECHGLQPAACEQTMRRYGWTGTASTVVMGPEQADITRPAGAIISNDPDTGATVSRDANVTFLVNPAAADMPTPPDPATVTDLTNRLLSNNPGTVLQEWPRETVETMARQCLRLAQLAGIDGLDRCSTLPIYPPSQTTTSRQSLASPNPSRLNTDPLPFVLTHKDGKPWPRGWLANIPVVCPSPRPAGTQCDEYPFGSADQGGSGHASAKLVDRYHNERTQAETLKAFYSNCRLSNAATDASADLLPADPLLDYSFAKPKFLVVPMPLAPETATDLCNGNLQVPTP